MYQVPRVEPVGMLVQQVDGPEGGNVGARASPMTIPPRVNTLKRKRSAGGGGRGGARLLVLVTLCQDP